MVLVEEVTSARPEAAELRPEHRFPDVAITGRDLALLVARFDADVVVRLRAVEGLLRAIVDAGDPERRQLYADGMCYLRVFGVDGACGAEPRLRVAVDHVVIVEDGHMVAPDLAVAAELVAPTELREEDRWIAEALRRPRQDVHRITEIESRIEVPAEHVEIFTRHPRAARDLAEEQKVLLTDRFGIFVDGAAEVARRLERDVLHGIDAHAIAVGERDPVPVDADQCVEDRARLRVGNEGLPLLNAQIFEIEEVPTPELVPRVERVLPGGRIEAANASRAGVERSVLELARPDPVVPAANRRHGLASGRSPGADVVGRLEAVGHCLRRSARSVVVEPIVTGVVVDDVEEHVHALGVGGVHEITQLLAGAEARIDVEEVLYPVPVIRLQVTALLPHRPDPERGRSEPAHVAELAADPADEPPLKDRPGRHPRPLVGSAVDLWMLPIERVPRRFRAVAEAIRKQEVEDLVAPIDGTRLDRSARTQIGVREVRRRGGFDDDGHVCAPRSMPVRGGCYPLVTPQACIPSRQFTSRPAGAAERADVLERKGLHLRLLCVYA